jgi:protoheme IX farnesyltransferase
MEGWMTTSIRSWYGLFAAKLHNYWLLTKSLQTALLLLTGISGYMSTRCPVVTWQTLVALTGSLYLAIAGSTVLNMVHDRDIDSRMQRTCRRPLPAGLASGREAVILGSLMVTVGRVVAFMLSPLFGLIVATGVFIDIVIYTVWLKRRTPWAIVWGGIAGGMPILAGRVLGLGSIDWIGIMLGVSVLLWIPVHIMTISMRHYEDYERANLPTFPSRYGFRGTRIAIAFFCLLAAAAMAAALLGMGMAWGYLRVLAILGIGLVLLAAVSLSRPSPRWNFGLFKYASAFMLSAMVLIVIETMP